MKKQLLLSLSLIISAGSLFAQIEIEENHKHDRQRTDNYTPNNNSKAGGGWFNYGREIQELSSDATGYYGAMHTDSTMITGYIDDATGDTTYYNVYQHSRGQILDPTSFNFIGLGMAENFFAGEGFILDSIDFPYEYIRPQTTNPDKLIVQVYTTATNGGIVQSSLVGGASFYHAEYDYLTSKGKNAVQTIEYDLTDNDATLADSTGYKSFALSPPVEMPNGGLVAVTYTFIPGNTFNEGDTLADHYMPWVVNPRNSFYAYYVRDSEPLLDPGYENYNLAITSDIQYNVSTTGWNGSYIPGNAWSTDNGPIINHQNIWCHLTPMVTPPINTTNMSTGNIKLFPNPARDKVNIVFNNSKDVTNIKITDLTGRTVYTETIANNTNAIEVNTSHYTPGIYFCEINGTKTIETIKFTKIK